MCVCAYVMCVHVCHMCVHVCMYVKQCPLSLPPVPPPKPLCSSFHNLFYCSDPLASRIEPLLDERFAKVAPFAVPRYRFFPRGELPCFEWTLNGVDMTSRTYTHFYVDPYEGFALEVPPDQIPHMSIYKMRMGL